MDWDGVRKHKEKQAADSHQISWQRLQKKPGKITVPLSIKQQWVNNVIVVLVPMPTNFKRQ
jgi:hypothetical protein